MTKRISALTLAVLAFPTLVRAQEREDRTLLTHEQMTSIVNEVSGERAMHHVLELVPYHRVRLPDDYKVPYRESQVVMDFAKQYGFQNVALEIRDFLSGEFTPLPLVSVMAVLNARQSAGQITLAKK